SPIERDASAASYADFGGPLIILPARVFPVSFMTLKKAAASPGRPRVALLIESSRAYGRGTLSGVAKYIREHGQWSIFLQEHSMCDDVPAWLENWQGDGIITRMENQAMARVRRRLRVPTGYLRDL